ncbi:MAG: hypothetical protein ACYC3Q_15800 [Gemmatimonadaceae bacterium]
MLNPDFRDMLFEFNAAGVEYLIVGGYAVGQHGYPRATGDMDFWVRRSPENAARVLHALAAFGAPEKLVTRDDLLDPDTVAQIGVEPNRIDILTAIDGVEFDDAYPDRVVVRLGDVDIPFVGLRHLIVNKRATGRPEDAVDAARLEAIVPRGESQPRVETPAPGTGAPKNGGAGRTPR